MLSLYLNMIGTEVERKRFEEVYYQHRKQMVFIADSVVHNKYREVLYYKIVLDLSVEQIARTVDRTESTVCKQIYRGKKMLAEMLKRGEMAECL